MSTYALPNTPVGDLTITEENGVVSKISWESSNAPQTGNTVKNLSDYFDKKTQKFDVAVAFKQGTPFQQKVWRRLCEIPYGETVTYGDLAKDLGSSPRAIGGAVGANPIPIVVPCHRVVGSNGKMTGFSGGNGIPTKEILLKLEKSAP